MPTSPRNNTPKKASSAADFKKKLEPTELPSGLFIRLSNKSLSGFILSGQVPNSLMTVITGAVSTKTGDADLMDEIIADPQRLTELFQIVDSFVCAVCVEPQVLPVPTDGEERDDDQLYVDELEQEDKMYIFSRAMGGTTDLESFRGELASGMDLVQQRENVVKSPKRSTRNKG